MSKIFVRERQKVGTGAGQPRFRVVAAFEADLKVYVPHLRRAELEQIAKETGAEVVYLTRGEQTGQSERDRVIEALGPSPVDIDELIRTTGVAARKVHIVLLELDLAGRLQRHGRQLVSLIEP